MTARNRTTKGTPDADVVDVLPGVEDGLEDMNAPDFDRYLIAGRESTRTSDADRR
jgi:hypothetical protein